MFDSILHFVCWRADTVNRVPSDKVWYPLLADKSSIRSKQPERQPNFKKNTARKVLRILTS